MSIQKEKIAATVHELLAKEYIGKYYEELNSLLQDIQNDFYTVVVLGEFKRGKSTFINALLGENLLPADVLPETATINALMYNEQPKLSVVMNDGSEKAGEPTNEYLKHFSAQNAQSVVENVKYIKVGYNADILKNNIVIVDTPGVSDINEQRCEVTYRFIPKANVVLFLLDANSPLKMTEKEFIEERLLKNGIDNIVFVVNKYDAVDDEEDEDFLDDLQAKLYKVFCIDAEHKLNKLRVFPLSAKWALQGITTNNQRFIDASGIKELEAEIKILVSSGNVENNKAKGYKMRLVNILSSMYSEMENKRSLLFADIDELKKVKDDLHALIVEQTENEDNIEKYVAEEQKNILRIIDKSLQHFYKKLEENIVEQIQFYKGLDFKDYVEQRISRIMQRELENWIAAYSHNIEELLRHMELEIARGMSYRLQQKIQLQAKVGNEIALKNFIFDFDVQDVSQATTKAGMLAAGGAGLMMLIGTPFAMPFISMAAFPFLQKRFLEEKLEEAKSEIIPEVQNQLSRYIIDLKQEIHKYVEARSLSIIQNSQESYKIVLNNLQNEINSQIQEKETKTSGLLEEASILTNNIDDVKNVLQSLQI